MKISVRAVAPLLTLVVAAAGVVATAAPASAHTGIGAIKDGCGSSYEKVEGSGADVTYQGRRFGRLILGRIPGTGNFCFVIRKTNATHGVNSRVLGAYYVSENNNDTIDPRRQEHYAFIRFNLPAGECVGYAGSIFLNGNEGRGSMGWCRG